MSEEPEGWAGEEEPDAFGPEPAGPVFLVGLEGGPMDGRHVASKMDAEWLAFHDLPVTGATATYRPTGRFTAEGRPILELIDNPPEALNP